MELWLVVVYNSKQISRLRKILTGTRQIVQILMNNKYNIIIMIIYSRFYEYILYRRVFLDGLLRAGTGAAVEVSVQILKSNELNPIEQKLVYLSFGNAKHVTSEAMKAAAVSFLFFLSIVL